MKFKQKISIVLIALFLSANGLMATKKIQPAEIAGVASGYASGKGKAMLAGVSACCSSAAQICMIGGIFTAPEAAAFGVLGL